MVYYSCIVVLSCEIWVGYLGSFKGRKQDSRECFNWEYIDSVNMYVWNVASKEDLPFIVGYVCK